MKGKGLGKLLFLEGIAHMKDLGFKKIIITGDTTVGRHQDTNETFYTKYGAKIIPGTGAEEISTECVGPYLEYLKQARGEN